MMADALELDGRSLTVEALCEVAFEARPVRIAPQVIPVLERSRQVLFDLAARGVPVYGLNHGVGWNKDREFSRDFFEAFNRNLIRSHSVGVSPWCSVEEVRAVLCIRLNAALNGRTGASVAILQRLADLLNHGIHPRIYRRGAVGEGDVNILGHVGQTIIGEGLVEYRGKIVPAREALASEGLEPLILGPKDGLSIVSSNAQGESLVLLAIRECERILRLGNGVLALSLEGLNGGLQPYGEAVNEVRGLPGQIACAGQVRRHLAGSYLEQPSPTRALQDPLCFRCGAAIHGSVLDALAFVKQYFALQINRSDDNPCVLYETGTVSVSPNFETTTLALGVDMLAAALCHMSHGVMNRIFHLVDPAFTKLPRFLSPDENRVICFSTMQKTIAALDAENRWLANICTPDIQPFAGGIEDHASNLPLAARRTLQMLDNLRRLLAMEAIHGAQAVDLRGDVPLGKTTQKLHDLIRTQIPFLREDRDLSLDIESAYALLGSEAVERLLGT